jgi:hypothetical protein
VWPGDANSDGIANSTDIFELGINFGQTGPARTATSNSWIAYYANNWTGLTSTSKNMAHSDCNGNGIIDLQDTLAVCNNYGLTHAFKPAGVTSTTTDVNIYPDQVSVPAGSWGSSSIFLGDTINAINNLYGVAFDIVYDTSLIQTDSVYIEYLSSFLNSGGSNILLRKRVFSNSILYAASVRSNATTVNGYGKIAKLHYKIKTTAPVSSILNIILQNGQKTTATGIINSLTAGTETVNVTAVATGINSLDNISYALFPNPSAGIFTVVGDFVSGDQILFVNELGQTVFRKQLSSSVNRIQTDEVADGVYQYVILREKQAVGRGKVIVQK